ncbi:MAG: hypothetical protein ACLFTK_09235 [Anaerolineales bacterium]
MGQLWDDIALDAAQQFDAQYIRMMEESTADTVHLILDIRRLVAVFPERAEHARLANGVRHRKAGWLVTIGQGFPGLMQIVHYVCGTGNIQHYSALSPEATITHLQTCDPTLPELLPLHPWLKM